jgi:hypothetical protein
MKLRVECYSGTKGDERPVRFYLGDWLLLVEEALEKRYGPNAASKPGAGGVDAADESGCAVWRLSRL